MTERSEIVVPASIGNVGPGFDALSVALQLYLRVRVLDVRETGRDGGSRVETTFSGGAPLGSNGVERAFRFARERFGRPAPAVVIEVSTEIPICAGLGSSAAASVAGLQLYQAVAGPVSEADMLAMAAELEGHPDNAAACLLGGFTVSCRLENGTVIARSTRWPSQVQWIIATPDVPLATKEARAVLPAAVPLGDAVFNLQRALLLLHAVEHERLEDLREAFRDRLHQPARAALVPGLREALDLNHPAPARAALVPGLREALDLNHPAILGTVLSGAGPSIAAAAVPGREQEAASALRDIYGRLRIRATVRILSVHQPASAGVVPIPIG